MGTQNFATAILAAGKETRLKSKRAGLLDRYFYFFMSLLIAAVVAYGFGQTVDRRLFHSIHPKPLLLSIHAAVFSAWVVFYIFQSLLVRSGNVRIHRRLGWFGVALGIAIPIVGTVTAVTMRRFDLHYPDLARTAPLLRTALLDLTSFTIPFALAIYWRQRPDLHRRLLLIATCALTAAAFVRFPSVFHPWPYYYVGVDLLVLLGVLRDAIVDRRVHPVYLYALPALILAQFTVMGTVLHFLP
ncbi:MAG: hypothetical protein ACRD28_09470 [Acidobacteriaceae bacterium]